jgi:cytoskeletal protein CcmA (bactofilin family)
MFERKKNKPAATVSEPASPQTPSVPVSSGTVTARSDAMIGSSIVIKGTVTGDEDLLIEGKVEGTIDLNSNVVSVGQSGRVSADINAKIVNIEGEVTGDITGNEKVVISKSGNVRGNIVAPRVTLEDGAIFKGSIDMDPGETSVKKVSLASDKPSGSGVAGSDSAATIDLKSG